MAMLFRILAALSPIVVTALVIGLIAVDVLVIAPHGSESILLALVKSLGAQSLALIGVLAVTIIGLFMGGRFQKLTGKIGGAEIDCEADDDKHA